MFVYSKRGFDEFGFHMKFLNMFRRSFDIIKSKFRNQIIFFTMNINVEFVVKVIIVEFLLKNFKLLD